MKSSEQLARSLEALRNNRKIWRKSNPYSANLPVDVSAQREQDLLTQLQKIEASPTIGGNMISLLLAAMTNLEKRTIEVNENYNLLNKGTAKIYDKFQKSHVNKLAVVIIVLQIILIAMFSFK